MTYVDLSTTTAQEHYFEFIYSFLILCAFEESLEFTGRQNSMTHQVSDVEC